MRQSKTVLKVELVESAVTETGQHVAYPASGVFSKLDANASHPSEEALAQFEAVFARGDAVRRGLIVADESERTRLINDITRLIREPRMPDVTRAAGLTLIGWLARRMPGEQAHALGVDEARESERRVKAARKATR